MKGDLIITIIEGELGSENQSAQKEIYNQPMLNL